MMGTSVTVPIIGRNAMAVSLAEPLYLPSEPSIRFRFRPP